MSGTLFEKYGGFKTVSRIVMTFYDMVLDDDAVGHVFENTDMAKLVDHQTKFVASLLGGPASFSDERLEQVHAHLGISHSDFDIVAGLLGDALAEHGMEPADIRAVAQTVETKRTLVVARDAA
ncbi:group I truncated hemoglobin [Shimia abyssi]|uniref:Hemoglobin n=1 Tax=Shimia abyssi TaxID=1662395 RepID=A0A2P8F6P0_9RHOB|nr:group 1 truncated hemoglobin [Shimia abyssi]PSL17375.1 hemoglobin [Shimia abyssi]